MLRWHLVDGRLGLGPDGRLVVTRPPLPGEADRLRALAGLSVPEVVADGPDLVVTWHPPAGDPGAVAAEVAAVLAAAHDRGVTHGPLVPEHVRAGGIVDGWAGGHDPTDDVAALGRLLLDAAPLPSTEAAVARRAAAEEPTARPTMRAMAEALRPPAPPPARPPRRPLRVPRWVPAAAALPVAAAALALTGGDRTPAAVAVEVRCAEVVTPASLDPASGRIRLDAGPVLAELPAGCEIVVTGP